MDAPGRGKTHHRPCPNLTSKASVKGICTKFPTLHRAGKRYDYQHFLASTRAPNSSTCPRKRSRRRPEGTSDGSGRTQDDSERRLRQMWAQVAKKKTGPNVKLWVLTGAADPPSLFMFVSYEDTPPYAAWRCGGMRYAGQADQTGHTNVSFPCISVTRCSAFSLVHLVRLMRTLVCIAFPRRVALLPHCLTWLRP